MFKARASEKRGARYIYKIICISYNFGNKRKQFWENYSEQKTEIQEEYYKFMNQHKINITFFDWFEEHYQNTHNQMINMAKNSAQWQTSQGVIIESNHPPFCTIKHIHQDRKSKRLNSSHRP